MKYSIIPNEKEIKEQLSLAEKYNLGFEYNEFFLPELLDDKAKKKSYIDFYKGINRDRSKDTLHGVFLDIAIHSEDRLIRDASDRRIHESMDVAEALGVKGVVFHTGLIPNYKSQSYIDNWLEKSMGYYNRLLEEYGGLEIYIENMFDSDYGSIQKLGQMMTENRRFGICLDYAHAAVFSDDSKVWYEELKPYIKHMHINDNDLVDDLHMAVGTGKIDWNTFFDITVDYDGMVLLEVTGLGKQKETLEFINKYNK